MTTRLVLHPARQAPPALKYGLLPELRDMGPGNAAEEYRRAAALVRQEALPDGDWRDRVSAWLSAPLAEFPRKEAREFLSRFAAAQEAADAAARRTYCDWGLTERLRDNGFASVLPEAQELRSVAQLLLLRISFDMAAGNNPRCLRGLQTGLAMARHVAEAPMLIPSLVGAAIAGMMLARVQEWIQQPGAPNLYWPLTDLPRPFLDLRKAMEGERVWAYGNFPGTAEAAADLHAPPWQAERVQAMMLRIREVMRDDPDKVPNEQAMADLVRRVRERRRSAAGKVLTDQEMGEVMQEVGASLQTQLRWAASDADEADLLRRMEAGRDSARKFLVEAGRPRELVDDMPPVQIALLASLRQYDEAFDEYLKLQSLPYWESQPVIERLDARRRTLGAGETDFGLPIARSFLPAVSSLFAARTRLDRHIAALRCVEAVRLHAAACDGLMPPALDQIDGVPIPVDPATGEPFAYELAGKLAVLSAPLMAGQPPFPANALRFELATQK